MNSTAFNARYYTQGNYRDYLTRKFEALSREIIDTTAIRQSEAILDFGCGYGGLLNAFWIRGFRNITGTDISQWAIEHGHSVYPKLKNQLQFYNRDLLRRQHRLVLFLDVLEHMPVYELDSVLALVRRGCRGSLAVRLPVSAREGEPFILAVSNNDPTHICCHTKRWWQSKLRIAGFELAYLFQCTSIYDSPGVLAAVFQ